MMAKKAFVVGINTQGLKYCDRDAELMHACLEKHGYDVAVVKVKQISNNIITSLEVMLDTCVDGDTIIFYFSGHGLVDRGELYLITDEDIQRIINKIPVNNIIGYLDACKADNRLIILDCCHAASIQLSPSATERIRVLTAADRTEKTKEFDEFKASFLAHRIHRALITYPPDVIGSDRKIRLNALSEWLQKEAKKNNARNSIKIPVPSLKGSDRVNFELVTIVEEESLISQAETTMRDSHVLLIELKEWKEMHTRMQSLLDNLAPVVKSLDRCRLTSENDLEKQLYLIEDAWSGCIPPLKEAQIVVAGFIIISHQKAIKDWLERTNEISGISRQFGSAATSMDAINIQRSIVDIKQNIELALKVADLQIVRIVDTLLKTDRAN